MRKRAYDFTSDGSVWATAWSRSSASAKSSSARSSPDDETSGRSGRAGASRGVHLVQGSDSKLGLAACNVASPGVGRLHRAVRLRGDASALSPPAAARASGEEGRTRAGHRHGDGARGGGGQWVAVRAPRRGRCRHPRAAREWDREAVRALVPTRARVEREPCAADDRRAAEGCRSRRVDPEVPDHAGDRVLRLGFEAARVHRNDEPDAGAALRARTRAHPRS